ncbi:DUF4255 domain-containing protein [Paenibacillus harenae]|uniref:Pvc16 N-terminal domain-containing protein n=1 Tax=Paenibacillus harenae TaxID=306543 RepID=A0ABT9TY81_PAEHA|nr:DUF4255 domain-containing protein [Paenibacillus harenae]MDQ0061118.1 hypothetical protein [Paenibacillus harenae]MDQ0111009.1 hypothetical protein [Paenibacillus harenae]
MGGYTVIADLGASMLRLLRDNLTPDPVPRTDLIGIASPRDAGDLALSLFLFNVKENGEARRTGMQDRGSTLQYPPQSLDFYFLMTAHSNADRLTKSLDEHRILGRAMQVLYDNSVLRSPYLEGTLAESAETIRLSLVSMEGEELLKLWQFGDLPYKLSVVYRVGPVMLDSTRTKSVSRVVERQIVLEEKGGG